MGNYNIILAITVIVSLYAIYLLISLLRIIYKSKQKRKNRREIRFNITEKADIRKPIEEVSKNDVKDEKFSTNINFELNGF